MNGGGLRLHIGAGFLLTAAAVFYLGGAKLLFAVLLADGVHELGHIAALLLWGGGDLDVRLSGGGAVIYCGGFDSRGAELICAAAGPAAGLLPALLCLFVPSAFLQYLAAASLLTTAFNLLPALPLDGGRIAQLLLSEQMSERGCDVLLRLSGCLSAALVCYVGLSLHSFFALAAGVYLAALVNFPQMR